MQRINKDERGVKCEQMIVCMKIQDLLNEVLFYQINYAVIFVYKASYFQIEVPFLEFNKLLSSPPEMDDRYGNTIEYLDHSNLATTSNCFTFLLSHHTTDNEVLATVEMSLLF